MGNASIDPRRVPWQRYWNERGASYPLGDQGFLSDPEAPLLRGLTERMKSLQALSDRRVLVLLGEPGAGKSTAIDLERARLDEQGGRCLLVTATRLVRDPSVADQLSSRPAGPFTLIVDAFDEGLSQNPAIGDALISVLEPCSPANLALRIVSRAQEWPVAMEERLRILSGTDRVAAYELAPLRRADVRLAVEAYGGDPDAFIECVLERDVVPLAIQPIALHFLIRQFLTGGTLPRSKVHLFSEGMLILSDEEATWQRGGIRPNADGLRRRAIAARTAAIGAFTNREVVSEASSPSADTLPVGILVAASERVDGATYHLDIDAVKDCLVGAALFSPGAEPATYVWSHQTYREFLAAWYLAHRELSPDTIESLYFGNGTISRIPGPLREIAAWHAAQIPAVFKLLVSRNPEVLLRSDSALVSDDARADLVGALLDRFQTVKTIDVGYWRDEYRRLDHAQLAEQLVPRILDREANVMARRAAMEIATCCKTRGAIGAIANVALALDDDSYAREAAVRALVDLGGSEAVEALSTLLRDGIGRDPDDTLRGLILSFLWPDHIDARTLFGSLTRRFRFEHIGDYQRFLLTVSGRLRAGDLPDALRWLAAGVLDGRRNHAIEKLEDSILSRALATLRDPAVVAAMVEYFVRAIRDKRGLWASAWTRKETRPTLSDADRRMLASQILLAIPDEEHLAMSLVYARPPLLERSDILSLVEQVPNASGAVLAALGRCAAQLYGRWGYYGETDVLDAVLGVEAAEFREPLRPYFDPVVVDSVVADSMRRAAREAAVFSRTAHPPAHPSRVEQSMLHLDAAERGDSTGWIALAEAWTAGWTERVEQDEDWQRLDEIVRERILSAARRFLASTVAPTGSWIDDDSAAVPDTVRAGRAAFQLLAVGSPSSLAAIDAGTWSAWTPSLVAGDWPECSGDARILLFRMEYAHAPQVVCDTIVRVVGRERRTGSVHVVQDLPVPYDALLQEALLGVFDQLDDRAMRIALEGLVSSGNPQALTLLSHFVQERPPANAAPAGRFMVTYDSQRWPLVISRMRADPTFLEQMIDVLRFEDERRGTSSLSGLNEPLTAQMIELVSQGEPSPTSGARRFFEPRARLRSRLLARLAEFGTTDSIDELQRLIGREPESQDIRAWLVKAEERLADVAWTPLAPAAFLRFLSTEPGAVPTGDLTGSIVLRSDADPDAVLKAFSASLPGARWTAREGAVFELVLPKTTAQMVHDLMKDSPSVRNAIISLRANGEWLQESVPEVPPATVELRDAKDEEMGALLAHVHVLVCTATDRETAALRAAMGALPGESALIVGVKERVAYTVGRLGHYAVAHLQATMGPDGPNTSSIQITDAWYEFKPKLVLLVGIAFGISRAKARLGDVLVAETITGYEMVKLKPDMTAERRGQRIPGDPMLVRMAQGFKGNWRRDRSDGSQVEVQIGHVLSGAKLVNQRPFRDALATEFPDAIGGEMEGIGAYSAAFAKDVPVLLVKAICDWADGHKNDDAQPFAAAAAADFLRYLLSRPNVLNARGVPALPPLPTSQGA